VVVVALVLLIVVLQKPATLPVTENVVVVSGVMVTTDEAPVPHVLGSSVTEKVAYEGVRVTVVFVPVAPNANVYCP
jgi:hypothetical protein